MKKTRKKPVGKTKPAKKPRAPKGRALGSPLDAFAGLSRAELEAFLNSIALGEDGDEESASELLESFIQVCDGHEPDSDVLADIGDQLISALDDLRMAAEGGDPEARAEREDVLQLLDEAVENDRLDGTGLMLLGRALNEAGWPTPEKLQKAAVKSLEEGATATNAPEELSQGFEEMLAELAELVDGDEFAFCAQLTSTLAIFPQQIIAPLVQGLAERAEGVTALGVAGFVLHADPAVAESVLAGLAASAAPSVDSRLVERLVRMRPWLSEARRPPLDAAIRALRARAGAPAPVETDELRKVRMTACDGSGGQNVVFATRRGRAHSAFVAFIKPSGIAEILYAGDISKREVDEMIDGAKSVTATSDADLVRAHKRLALALADNVAHDNPPPYDLVRLVERLGLGPLTPDASTPAEIADEILSESLPLHDDALTLAAAHKAIVGSVVAESWFEAGETIEDLLLPARTRKQSIDALMKGYLPGRRAFWAKTCAVSAFALRGPAASKPAPYALELALLARDLLSDRPIESLPLMRKIAETTVDAFYYNARRR